MNKLMPIRFSTDHSVSVREIYPLMGVTLTGIVQRITHYITGIVQLITHYITGNQLIM